ncbi:hypothetical protein [Inhella crocodyli]|nr:hypothetical protein [Inhella crocodyli]
MHPTSMHRRFVLGLSLAWLAGKAGAATPGWLKGRWELMHDPDGSPKDFLEFGDGNEVLSISERGRVTSGVFAIRDEGIQLSFLLPNGKTVRMLMLPSANQRQLRVKSNSTGNVAVYEKTKR